MTTQTSDTEQTIMYMIHDVEPAIVSFQSLLKLLQRNKFSAYNPYHQRLVKSCDTALSYSRELLEGMLEYARLQERRISLNPTRIPWDTALEEILAIPFILAEDKDIRLNWTTIRAGLSTFTDLRLLKRIVNNLVINAIKNSDYESQIQVRVDQDGSFVVIRIEDEGPGLPEEHLDQMFHRHIQLQMRATGEYSGVGLGLSFCKEATALLRGTLTVQNRQLSGLCFTLTLPDLDREESPEERQYDNF